MHSPFVRAGGTPRGGRSPPPLGEAPARKRTSPYYAEIYAKVQKQLLHAGELNLIRTPGTPETIDFDARITRAEFCVMLYRAGLTEFGCCAESNLKKKKDSPTIPQTDEPVCGTVFGKEGNIHSGCLLCRMRR